MSATVRANKQIGVMQEYADMIGSRLSGVTYTNPYNRPIGLVVWVTGKSEPRYLYVDGEQVGILNGESDVGVTATAIIPAGSTYKVEGSVNAWYELF